MGFKELRAALASVALLVLFGAVAGCGDAVGPSVERLEAEARWANAGIGAYSYVVSHFCGECGEGTGRVVRVSVRDGRVASRIFVDDRTSDTTVPEAVAQIYPAVEALFEAIRAGEMDPASDVIAEYDLELGYPTRIDITASDPRVVDGETGWVISDFTTS